MAAKRLVKTSSRIFSYIDLNDYGLQSVPPDRRASTKADVGEFVVSRIKRSLRNSSSPVAGEGFKTSLSTAYRSFKTKVGAGSSANLQLFGDLLNSLEAVSGPGGQVGFGHTGAGRDGRPNARKCVGHCHFEGSKLPRRRYLPARGQSFKKDIEAGIKEIVELNQVTDLSQVSLEGDVVASVFDTQTLVDLWAGQAIDDIL